MDEKKRKLRVGVPVDGNEQFEVVQLPRDLVYVALRAKNGWYIAFNEDGIFVPDVVDINSFMIPMHLNIFR